MKNPATKVSYVASTRLTRNDAQRLDALAQRLNLPASAVVRRAVRAYLATCEVNEGRA
ncbi:MAG: ribbon-helix-helix protein, CopG family [Chloroflexales bacterium]